MENNNAVKAPEKKSYKVRAKELHFGTKTKKDLKKDEKLGAAKKVYKRDDDIMLTADEARVLKSKFLIY